LHEFENRKVVSQLIQLSILAPKQVKQLGSHYLHVLVKVSPY